MISQESDDRKGQKLGVAALIALAAISAVAIWQTTGRSIVRFERVSDSVMGTVSRIAVFDKRTRQARVDKAMAKAESALRRVESRMSRRIELSEAARLNTAPANEEIPLSADTLTVLRAARQAWEYSNGAFDATRGPLIQLWIEAGKSNSLPAEGKIRAAKNASNWTLIELRENAAIKQKDTARVDLGGIAKGFGIDKALDRLREISPIGGMVDVGGDLACFGHPGEEDAWTVEVRDPFQENTVLGTFEIESVAVCTSGNYARFVEIEGRRYSHILDPRTGYPAEGTPSVTVTAPTAMKADAWATSLSVLGEEGLELLPEGVEAMLILGNVDSWKMVRTEGFPEIRSEHESIVFP